MESSAKTIDLKMTDGYIISVHLFESQSPKAVILIGSALGVGQYYYYGIAKYLAENGFTVITHDYRGVGLSAPLRLYRGFDAGFGALGKDFETIIDWSILTYPHLPMLLLGHSLGGIIPMFAKNIGLCRAAFLVGSQTAYFKDFGNSKLQFLKTTILWHGVVPLLTNIFGYFPGRKLNLRMENIPFKLIKDIQQRRKHKEATDFLLKIGVDSQHLNLNCPVNFLTFSDDPICTRIAMQRLIRDFKNAEVQNQVINTDPIGKVGHAGFFRKKHKETLWPKVSNWFENILMSPKEYSHQIINEYI